MENTLYVIPFENPWQSLASGANAFSEDFMEDRNEPEQQKRESFE